MRRALQALSLVLALLSAASCRKQAAGPLLPPADEYRGWTQTVPAALGFCALLPPASGAERAAAAAARPRGIYRAAAEGDIAALEAALAGGEPRGLGPAEGGLRLSGGAGRTPLVWPGRAGTTGWCASWRCRPRASRGGARRNPYSSLDRGPGRPYNGRISEGRGLKI